MPPSAAIPLLPPHLLAPPPPQNCGLVQVPQRGVVPPQPSPTTPHVAPTFAQVFAVQTKMGPPSEPTPELPPHLLGPPPPQNCGLVQVPVALDGPMDPPQPPPPRPPSPAMPQSKPSWAQVLGMHLRPPSTVLLMSPPQIPGPPPPQNCGLVQVPQLGVSPPHSSDCWPQAFAP